MVGTKNSFHGHFYGKNINHEMAYFIFYVIKNKRWLYSWNL